MDVYKEVLEALYLNSHQTITIKIIYQDLGLVISSYIMELKMNFGKNVGLIQHQ